VVAIVFHHKFKH